MRYHLGTGKLIVIIVGMAWLLTGCSETAKKQQNEPITGIVGKTLGEAVSYLPKENRTHAIHDFSTLVSRAPSPNDDKTTWIVVATCPIPGAIDLTKQNDFAVLPPEVIDETVRKWMLDGDFQNRFDCSLQPQGR